MTKKKVPENRPAPRVDVNAKVDRTEVQAFLKQVIKDSGYTQAEVADLSNYAREHLARNILKDPDYISAAIFVLRCMGYNVEEQVIIKTSKKEG